MNIFKVSGGFAVFLSLNFPLIAAQENPSPYAGENVSIILYDAETIERLNAKPDVPSEPDSTPPAEPQPDLNRTERPASSPNTAQPMAEPIRLESPPPPAYPVDISHLFNASDGPTPIIDGPPECTSEDLAIRVTATGITKVRGRIVVDVHNDVPEDFLDSDKTLYRIWAPVTGETTTFCVPLRAPGDYALGLYQDENENEKFDKNFLGLPKERFGVSRNPKYGLSKPDYEDAAFEATETGADLTIDLVKASDLL